MKSTRVSFPQKFRLMAPIVTVYTANSVLLSLSWDFSSITSDTWITTGRYTPILEVFTTRMRSQSLAQHRVTPLRNNIMQCSVCGGWCGCSWCWMCLLLCVYIWCVAAMWCVCVCDTLARQTQPMQLQHRSLSVSRTAPRKWKRSALGLVGSDLRDCVWVIDCLCVVSQVRLSLSLSLSHTHTHTHTHTELHSPDGAAWATWALRSCCSVWGIDWFVGCYP